MDEGRQRTTAQQSTIDGSGKGGRDTAVKAKAAPVVNVAFCSRVDHGGSGKVGTDGRVAADNRQQWQRQSGNNQLKVKGCKRLH